LLITLLVLGIYFLAEGRLPFLSPRPNREARYLSLFSEVSRLVRDRYVDEVDPADKFPAAFTALVSSADPDSAYLDEIQTKKYRLFYEGKGYRLGLFGAIRGEAFWVQGVFPNSPAANAGVVSGDRILAVNDIQVAGLSRWEALLSFLFIDAGSCRLTLERETREKPWTIGLFPDIETYPVAIREVAADTAYIPLCCMTVTYLDRLGLKRMIDSGRYLNWILDLRWYSGGDWEGLLRCAEICLSKTYLTIEKKTMGEKKIQLGTDESLPGHRVCLIDASTVLLAELMAHLLADEGVPTVGETTGGYMPLVRQFHLQDGSSVVLSVGRFAVDKGPLPTGGLKPSISCPVTDEAILLARCQSVLGDPG